MTKQAMITYNTLHSAKKNKVVRVVEREARGRSGLPPLGERWLHSVDKNDPGLPREGETSELKTA